MYATTHLENTTNPNNIGTKHYPLLRGMVDPPVKDEQILSTVVAGVKYYLGPINTTNQPNWNIDHLHQMTTVQGNGENVNKSKDFEDASPKREHSRLCKFVNTDLDYPEGVTTGLRRTTDQLRSVVERTRGDITIALERKELERSINSLKEELNN